MKKVKLLTIILVVLAAMFIMSGIAQANFAIHGGYLADTDACAGCHRAHTATSAVTWIDNAGSRRSALLVGPPTTQVYIFCYVCHSSGAPGAATDVEGGVLDSTSPGGAVEGAHSTDVSAINDVLNGGGFELLGNDLSAPTTSTHEVKGAAWQAWGKDTNIAGYIFMDCVSCHDPHGSSNYRILKDYVNGHWVGGYSTASAPAAGATAATIGGTDPDPLPFVISNERGYPLKGSPVPASTETGTSGGPISSAMMAAPTNGWRLHRQYNNGNLVANDYNETFPGSGTYYEYLPSYTIARYARGENAININQTDPNKGMSAWCCACHENYMARTSISKWAIGSVGNGDANPGTPGNYPVGAGTTTVLATELRDFNDPVLDGISADELDISVKDATGFPDPIVTTFMSGQTHETDRNPKVQEIKYIGIWGDGDTIHTNEGDLTIPKFEMVAYKNITDEWDDDNNTPGADGILDTFIVPFGGRGAFDTAQQAFANGALVYLGYDASDGMGDLVRHRHPMNVPFTQWQQDTNADGAIDWVAGDRALVLKPSEWQAFESEIPYVDIPIDHKPGYPYIPATNSEQLLQADEIADSTIGGNAIANEDHYTSEDWIECLTCHRAHGTSATMSGYAGATLQPQTIEGFNTLVPNPGTDDGVPPTGDSALLRANERGVCERCHNK